MVFLALRILVTVLYLFSLVGTLMLVPSDDLPVAYEALAFTAVYAILMALLWLHQRFPPPKQ